MADIWLLKTVEVKRCEHETGQANRGNVFYEKDFIGFSLECPNLDNKPFVSRINAGTYYADKVYTEDRGWFWLLEDANGRTEIILFHPGSTLINIKTGKRNFEGCVGLGMELDMINGERAISETQWMCKEFIRMTEGEKRLRVIIT